MHGQNIFAYPREERGVRESVQRCAAPALGKAKRLDVMAHGALQNIFTEYNKLLDEATGCVLACAQCSFVSPVLAHETAGTRITPGTREERAGGPPPPIASSPSNTLV